MRGCYVKNCLCFPSVTVGSIFKKSMFIFDILARKYKFLADAKSVKKVILQHCRHSPTVELPAITLNTAPVTHITAPAHPHYSSCLTTQLHLPTLIAACLSTLLPLLTHNTAPTDGPTYKQLHLGHVSGHIQLSLHKTLSRFSSIQVDSCLSRCLCLSVSISLSIFE